MEPPNQSYTADGAPQSLMPELLDGQRCREPENGKSSQTRGEEMKSPARITAFVAAALAIPLSHVTARFVADILKPPFSRLRPFEAIGSHGWHDTFFAPVGNSFPSGHAAHF